MPQSAFLPGDPQRDEVVRSIRRDVVRVLCIKVVVILFAAFFVFGAAQRVFVDPAVMTHKLCEVTHVFRCCQSFAAAIRNDSSLPFPFRSPDDRAGAHFSAHGNDLGHHGQNDLARCNQVLGSLVRHQFCHGGCHGITMEFQFGTNWAYYAHYVGDIFGAPLAIEGMMAFFLEATS